MRFRRRSSFVAFLAALTSCDPGADAVEAWLNCDECLAGERAAVASLGNDVVPRLELVLREGPDSIRRRIMREKFRGAFAGMSASPLSESQYIDQLLANAVANAQKRAATSLADINSSAARDALAAALSLASVNAAHYRSDVVGVIRQAHALVGATRFTGTIAPRAFEFGDTIVVQPPTGVTLAADAARFDQSLFPPNDIRLPPTGIPRRVLAVNTNGPHVLRIGMGTADQVASVILTTLRDENDRATAECPPTDLDCFVNRAQRISLSAPTFTTFFTQWRSEPRSDTLDFFRFESPAATTRIVSIDWRNATGFAVGNFRVRTRGCGSAAAMSAPGPLLSSPVQVPITLPASGCQVILLILQDGTTEPIFGRVRLVP